LLLLLLLLINMLLLLVGAPKGKAETRKCSWKLLQAWKRTAQLLLLWWRLLLQHLLLCHIWLLLWCCHCVN
jgi:hypothetical protein